MTAFDVSTNIEFIDDRQTSQRLSAYHRNDAFAYRPIVGSIFKIDYATAG
jgi:hypothetical protein